MGRVTRSHRLGRSLREVEDSDTDHGEEHPGGRVRESDRGRRRHVQDAHHCRGGEVTHSPGGTKQAEAAAAQVVWEEPREEARLGGFGQSDPAPRERERCQ
jgi:hypothetical protein